MGAGRIYGDLSTVLVFSIQQFPRHTASQLPIKWTNYQVTKKWNEHFLRSGVPLEYDVGRILAAKGMHIHADFPYLREGADGSKEFSVDINAYDIKEKQVYGITLLVECKHRSQEKVFMFIRDPNPDSPGVTGQTISKYDQWVPVRLNSEPLEVIEEGYNFAYKAIELYSNGAFDKDFRSGIEQLRYATPVALQRFIEWSTDTRHPTDVWPFFFSRVLVTNGKLRLLNDGVSVDDIRRANRLDDVSEEIDTTIFVSDYGPDYERHFKRSFELNAKDLLFAAKDQRKWLKENGADFELEHSPVKTLRGLMSGSRYELASVSRQTFVVTAEAFPALLDGILAACADSFKKRRRPKRQTSKRD